MNDKPVAVEAEVVPAEKKEVNTNVDAIVSQQANFKAQLDQVKKNMTQYQQAFENEKVKGIKLEGALESLDLLLKSLQK